MSFLVAIGQNIIVFIRGKQKYLLLFQRLMLSKRWVVLNYFICGVIWFCFGFVVLFEEKIYYFLRSLQF